MNSISSSNEEQGNDETNVNNHLKTADSTKEKATKDSDSSESASNDERANHTTTTPQHKRKPAVASKSAPGGSSQATQRRNLPSATIRKASAKAAAKREKDAKHKIAIIEDEDSQVVDLSKDSYSDEHLNEPPSDGESSLTSQTAASPKIPKITDIKGYRALHFMRILEDAEKTPSPIPLQQNKGLNTKQEPIYLLHALGLVENGLILKVTKFPLLKVLESGKAPYDELNTAMKNNLDSSYHPWVARFQQEFVKALNNWKNLEAKQSKKPDQHKLSKLFKQQQHIMKAALMDNDEELQQILRASSELQAQTHKLLTNKNNKDNHRGNMNEFIQQQLKDCMANIYEDTASLVNQAKIIEIIVGMAEIHNIINLSKSSVTTRTNLDIGEATTEETMAPSQYTPDSLAQLIAQHRPTYLQQSRKRARSADSSQLSRSSNSNFPQLLINPYAPDFQEFISNARLRNRSSSSRGTQFSNSNYVPPPFSRSRAYTRSRASRPRGRGGRGDRGGRGSRYNNQFFRGQGNSNDSNNNMDINQLILERMFNTNKTSQEPLFVVKHDYIE